jgi:hypothetical protein
MDLVEPCPPMQRVRALAEQVEQIEGRLYGHETLDEEEAVRLRAERDLLLGEERELRDNAPLGLRRFDDVQRLGEETTIELDVDPAHFATAKSNTWLTRKLAGLFPWDRKPIDPCQVRQRAIFTACSLPLLAALGPSALPVAGYESAASRF